MLVLIYFFKLLTCACVDLIHPCWPFFQGSFKISWNFFSFLPFVGFRTWEKFEKALGLNSIISSLPQVRFMCVSLLWLTYCLALLTCVYTNQLFHPFWFMLMLIYSFTLLTCTSTNLLLHTFGLCFCLFTPCFHLVLVSIYFILDTLFFMEVSRTLEASPLFIFIGWRACKEHQNQAWPSTPTSTPAKVCHPYSFFSFCFFGLFMWRRRRNGQVKEKNQIEEKKNELQPKK